MAWAANVLSPTEIETLRRGLKTERPAIPVWPAGAEKAVRETESFSQLDVAAALLLSTPFQAIRAVATTNSMKPSWLIIYGLEARVRNSPSGA